MNVLSERLDQIAQRHWDVIIVGAGMGGASASRFLANAGLKVLLVEKGKANVTVDATKHWSNPDKRLDVGYWPTQIRTCLDGKLTDTWPLLGCGVGGSTLHYGAALQRFEPMDFDPWPIDYKELEPSYQIAEQMFNVHGSADGLSVIDESSYQLKEPPPMGEFDSSMFDSFNQIGLHPYRIHVALDPDPDCADCAAGTCIAEHRIDAAKACLTQPDPDGNLQVLDETDVIELPQDGTSISGVVVQRGDGGRTVLLADHIVLAAGAFATPKLLLQSVSEQYPNGIGNDHGPVGRYLMFHASDFIAIWPRRKRKPDRIQKSMAFRDFYAIDGVMYGEVQSMGFPTNPGDILQFLHNIFWRSPFRHVPLLRHALRIPAYIGSRMFKEAAVYSSIIQDFPYPQNRVTLDASAPSQIKVNYDISDELRERTEGFRARLKERLQDLRSIRLNQDISLNLGHPCGTCRAGTDPRESVVDSSFKVHGTDNLYIADASVFTTSGGTNPSLTIAACAIHCAGHVLRRYAAANQN